MTDHGTAPFGVTGVALERIQGVTLPFDSGSFDVVVYNHVIEHVGDRATLHRAFSESRRVLAPGGRPYLAVPNRWAFIEPHYLLPLLSWLPQRLADALVRRFHRGAWHDCNPFGRSEPISHLRKAGFEVEDASLEAIRHVVDLELRPSWTRTLIEAIPQWPTSEREVSRVLWA